MNRLLPIEIGNIYTMSGRCKKNHTIQNNDMKRIFHLLIFLLCLSCSSETGNLYHIPLVNSTIHLSLKNDLVDTLSINALIYTNIPKGAEVSGNLSIINAGDYFLQVAIDRPAKSFLYIGDNQYNVFLSPFDTTQVLINEVDQKLELSYPQINVSTN